MYYLYEIIQVGVEPVECAARWESHSDKFVRELKKVKGGKSGDAGLRYKRIRPLFGLMEFLMSTIQHRQLVSVQF